MLFHISEEANINRFEPRIGARGDSRHPPYSPIRVQSVGAVPMTAAQ
jgi:hypothetical protein